MNFHASKDYIFDTIPYPGAKRGSTEEIANARALLTQWPSVNVTNFRPLVDDEMYRIMTTIYHQKQQRKQRQ